MKLDVMYQSSNLYAPMAGVSITSLLENNRHFDEINIYILDDGISEENKKRFHALSQKYSRPIRFINAADISKKAEALNAPKWRGTYTMYCKLFSLTMLPDSIDRIVYLDSDTLVCGKLDELAMIDLSGAPCAMVVAPYYNKNKRFIGLKEDDIYYEAGNIVFNLDYWKKNNCEDQVVSYIKNPDSRYYAADMDILNALFSKQICKLPLRYGVCSGHYLYSPKQIYQIYLLNEQLFYPLDEIEEASAHPVVCHFTGGGISGRPWESGNFHARGKLWTDCLSRSLWNDYVMRPVQPTPLLKVQRMLYKVLPSLLYVPIHRMMLHMYLKKNIKKAEANRVR